MAKHTFTIEVEVESRSSASRYEVQADLEKRIQGRGKIRLIGGNTYAWDDQIARAAVRSIEASPQTPQDDDDNVIADFAEALFDGINKWVEGRKKPQEPSTQYRIKF